MAQNYDPTFDIYNTKWGTTGQTIQDFFDTIFTQNSGDTAPENPVNGEPWLDTSDGLNNAVLKFYNGSEWILANEYNPYIEDLKLSRMDKDTLWQFLSVAHNSDGTLKANQAENLTEWVDSASIPTYVSATKFSITGDQTDIFVQNRKVKATLDASTVYSAVDSSSYDSGNDETTVTLCDSVLDSTLQKVEYGLVKPGAEGSQARPIYEDDADSSMYSLKIVNGSLALEEV